MQSAPARGRRGLAVVAAVLALTVISIGIPAATRASTESTMESSLRVWINRDRVAHGLRKLRNDTRLELLAGDRATWMASTGSLTHDSADGSPCTAMTTRSIAWYRCGEDIGYTTATWGKASARYIYNLWRHSAGHWALLMSTRFNYLGVGVARRSNGTTYASIVFLEGPDRTAPTARMTSKTEHGRDIKWTWTGADVKLQTHTAGIRSYNVQLRVDNGAYVQIRTNTNRTSVTLLNRPRGHWYSVRVQAKDRRGNLSAWSHGMRAWIP